MGVMKYAEIIRIDLIEKATYIWEQLIWGGIMAVIIFIFVHVWTAIYAGKPTIEGFTLAQMIWYLAIAETMMFTLGMEFIERIGDEVRNGSVGIGLLKPLNYVAKEFSLMFSNFLFKLVVIGAIALAVAQAMVGTIPIDVITKPLFLITAFGACLLNFCIICSLGLTAFWFEDSKSMFFLYQKAIFVLGGMLVPLEVYPAWMQSILQYLPTTYLVYAPAKLFVAFDQALFMKTLLMQVLWLAVMFGVMVLIYRRGIRKVTSHGG